MLLVRECEYYYDPKAGPPSALELLKTPSEVFNYAKQLVQDMETLIGVNSVSRGNPEASLESGSALALVHNQSVQFSQALQQSYVQLLEDIGNAVVNILKRYANTKRVALITGKSNRTKLESFTGEDLMGVSRVMVDLGNPLTRTTAGRINIAEQLMNQGIIKNPQQFLEVLTTGRLEPMYESEMAELNLIRAENESLAEGGDSAIVIRTDNHQLHIQEHLSVLATPEARQDPARVQAVLDHVAQHEQELQIIQQFGISGQPQIPAATGENGTSQKEAGRIPKALDASNPELTEEGANLPSLPKVAGTNQQFDPEGGNV